MDQPKSKPTPLGSGGTEGGTLLFWIGMGLCGLSIAFFLNSVYATSGMGLIRGMFHGRGGGGNRMLETTSMGVLFVPFMIGTIALFYNSKLTWAWVLTGLGLGLIFMEILSGLRFVFSMKVSTMIVMMLIFAAGAGLMLRSYWPVETKEET